MSEKRPLRALLAAAGLGLLAAAGSAPGGPNPANELLRRADRPRDAFPEAVIRVKATVLENGKAGPPAEFDLYKKGDHRTLAVFRSGSQKGRKILTSGEKFWLIVPGSARAIPVSPSQRLVGGASMGDVARLRYAEEFHARLADSPQSLDGRECDVLELQAHRPDAPYGSGTLWMDRRQHLIRRAVLNLVSGKPAREVLFEEYGTENGRPVVRRMRIRDLLSTRTKLETLLEYSQFRKASLPDSLFTPEGALDF